MYEYEQEIMFMSSADLHFLTRSKRTRGDYMGMRVCVSFISSPLTVSVWYHQVPSIRISLTPMKDQRSHFFFDKPKLRYRDVTRGLWELTILKDVSHVLPIPNPNPSQSEPARSETLASSAVVANRNSSFFFLLLHLTSAYVLYMAVHADRCNGGTCRQYGIFLPVDI